MNAESSLLLSAVEGKQTAKVQKVTAVVPGVENGALNAHPECECAETFNLSIDLIPGALRNAG
jgi:hypothetical protein